MQPPSRATIFLICEIDKFTGVIVSIVSAVPAGDVIERDEVLGIVSPAAATIATTIGVVRLPGIPPTLCLSRIIGESQCRRFPVLTMALVRSIISSIVRLSWPHAVIKLDK